MTTKLGKNAQRILDYLRKHPDRWYTANAGIERGPQGGKFRPYGQRDRAGAQQLVKLGLAEVARNDRHQIYRGGYASHCNEFSIKLKGRD